jgi:cytidine deaminase
MSELIFKTITLDPQSDEGFRLVDLSPAQSKKRDVYLKALSTASRSQVPSPIFSKYFCKECATELHGSPVPAGNIEYGFLQALHGEESAVAALRASYPHAQGEDIVLGFYDSAKRVMRPDSPCGNCRDIMRENFGENFEIVAGNPESEIALVVPMSFYLFENYRPVKVEGRHVNAVQRIVFEGRYLENDFYSPADVHPRRKYYVGIKTVQKTYFGAHDIMCDYHPIYALRDAVRQARRNHDPYFEEVWIVGKDVHGEPPDVMYKDRQHLLELNLEQELLLGMEYDPTVFLATYDGEDGKPRTIWQTTAKEWLPFPFAAKNFMNLDAMAEYFKKFAN